MTEGLTALDVMVLVSLAVAGIFGWTRGFVREIFSLAAWVAGFFAVKAFHVPASAILAGPVGTAGGAAVFAVVLCFGVAFLAVRLIGTQLGRSTRQSILNPVDRILGFGFGLLKGLFAATMAFLLMSLVFDTLNGAQAPRPSWMAQSRTYQLLKASSAALVGAIDAGRAR